MNASLGLCDALSRPGRVDPVDPFFIPKRGPRQAEIGAAIEAQSGLVEDIVAIKITLESGESRYFLTWGRIPEAVDPMPLLAIVREHMHGYALEGTPVALDLCSSLQEAAGEPFFYEALFHMSQKPIPYGPKYRAWAKRIHTRLKAGKELHYLGRPLIEGRPGRPPLLVETSAIAVKRGRGRGARRAPLD